LEKQLSPSRLSAARKKLAGYITDPIVRFLAASPISPNALSWSGFAITLVAAALIATGHLIAAGFVVLFGGFFDMLDGALARRTDRTTIFGAVLDATLDRLSEAALLLGIVGYFLFSQQPQSLFSPLSREWAVILAFVALFSSQTVSYIRARAEAMGLECQVGILTRTERVILLTLGLWLNLLVIALAVIALLSLVTVVQRIHRVARQTKN